MPPKKKRMQKKTQENTSKPPKKLDVKINFDPFSISCLKTKELSSILNDKKNEDLLSFTRDFYHLLAAANPRRETFHRKLEDERLEALSRILVGDETCTAIAFDDKHFLIATNLSNHVNQSIKIDTEIHILPDSNYKTGFNMQFIYNVTILENQKEKNKLAPIKGETIQYLYDSSRDELIPNKEELEVIIEPSQHLILSMPNINFKQKLSVIKNATTEFYSDINVYNFSGDPSDFSAEGTIGIKSPYPPVNFDPLIRRAEVILEHLSMVLLAEHSKDKLLKEKANEAIKLNRTRLLKQSLSWEIAKWCSANINMRDYTDYEKGNYKNEIDNFIELLINEYNRYIKHVDIIDNPLKKVISDWICGIRNKLKTKELTPPEFLNSYMDRILKNMARYLNDIEDLEYFIIADANQNGQLSKFIQEKINPFKKKHIKIIDFLEDKVHAEMRILWYFQNLKKQLNYIAISKLCCAHCSLVMKQMEITTVCGRHGKAYPNWKLSKHFKNENFLKRFFGEELYAKYLLLENACEVTNTGIHYTKADLALLIVQSIANISDTDLKNLNISDKKLWNLESEFPDKFFETREGKDISTVYWYEDSEVDRLLRLQIMQNQNKTQTGLPIYILGPIDNISLYGLAETLRDHNRKEGLVLIPFNLGLLHWVGLILEYDNDGNLIKANYYDSLGKNIPSFLNEILKTMSRESDNVTNFTRIGDSDGLIRQINGSDCGPCTIENLLAGAGYREPLETDETGRRLRHLKLLEIAEDNEFYNSFYERQRLNQSSFKSKKILSATKLNESTLFTITEYKELLCLALKILKLSKDFQEKIKVALQPKEIEKSEDEEHALHLARIRIVLNELINTENETIVKQFFYLGENTNSLEDASLKIDYNQILPLSIILSLSKEEIEADIKIIEEISLRENSPKEKPIKENELADNNICYWYIDTKNSKASMEDEKRRESYITSLKASIHKEKHPKTGKNLFKNEEDAKESLKCKFNEKTIEDGGILKGFIVKLNITEQECENSFKENIPEFISKIDRIEELSRNQQRIVYQKTNGRIGQKNITSLSSLASK